MLLDNVLLQVPQMREQAVRREANSMVAVPSPSQPTLAAAPGSQPPEKSATLVLSDFCLRYLFAVVFNHQLFTLH
jgi:hypothetical protein